MRILIKLLTALSALLIGTMASGQDEVTLTVFGEGATKDEATTNALRSAIEQAYGVFVSADTKILNDELIKDEIATISTGNIKSYKELSQVKTPDGRYNISLSAVVSIQNLTKYSQSHGSSAEFAGQTFAYNMRMRELNKKNEMIALRNMIEQLRSIQNDIFDYNIVEVKEPQFISDGNYSVSVTVDITTNPNYENFIKIISNTLSSLSLTWDEIKNYYSNNMSFQLFLPYYTMHPTLISRGVYYPTISDYSPNSGYFYMRSNLRDLKDIAEQICSIYNNAQRSFSIHSKDDSHKEWSPSRFTNNYLTTDLYDYKKIILFEEGDQRLIVDTTLYLRPLNYCGSFITTNSYQEMSIKEEITHRFEDKDIIEISLTRDWGKGISLDLHYYSLRFPDKPVKKIIKLLFGGIQTRWVPLSIPSEPGKSVVTITIPFQYDIKTLSSLKGFDVVRKSID